MKFSREAQTSDSWTCAEELNDIMRSPVQAEYHRSSRRGGSALKGLGTTTAAQVGLGKAPAPESLHSYVRVGREPATGI